VCEVWAFAASGGRECVTKLKSLASPSYFLACFGSRAGYYLELEFEGSDDFSVRWGGRKREPVKEELVCRRQQLGMNM
jgi:hypothetical protein